jgi:hypothetical protein
MTGPRHHLSAASYCSQDIKLESIGRATGTPESSEKSDHLVHVDQVMKVEGIGNRKIKKVLCFFSLADDYGYGEVMK